MLRVPLVWLGLATLKSEGVAGDQGRGAARINPALAVPGYARPKASEEAATRVSYIFPAAQPGGMRDRFCPHPPEFYAWRLAPANQPTSKRPLNLHP